ncbi:MAG TPA: LysE family transporter [Candidatus Eisenbacteria bacterium]|nr:LysE family transporter [Candidatus Eisenbacteria bacterium]
MLSRGLVLGFSIAAPVGPIGILCIRRTLTEGRAAGFVSGLGAATADALYGCVAAFGLTLVSESLLRGKTWLAWGGGAFLLWLGWRTLVSRPPEAGGPASAVSAGGAPAARSLWGSWASTFLLTITNPMTILSFAALFAGMGLGSIAKGPASAFSLVTGVFAGSAAWWFSLSGTVSLLRGRFDAGGLLWVNRVSGAILLLFGLLALFMASGL